MGYFRIMVFICSLVHLCLNFSMDLYTWLAVGAMYWAWTSDTRMNHFDEDESKNVSDPPVQGIFYLIVCETIVIASWMNIFLGMFALCSVISACFLNKSFSTLINHRSIK